MSLLLGLFLACGSQETADPVQPTAPPLQVSLPQAIGPGEPRRPTSPMTASEEHQQAMDRLEQVVKTYASDPTNPWAVAHGLVALGPDMVLANQQPAVDWLFTQYADRFDTGAGWAIRFPEARGETRIEPHPDLILKALADAGVRPDRPVQVEGEDHVVGDLYRGTLAETFFDKETGKSSFGTPNDLAWTLMGLASWSEKGTEWITGALQEVSLDDLTDHAFLKLSTATAFLAKAKKQGTGFRKRGQGIFAFTCGGAHMIQGVNHARLRGFGYASQDGPIRVQADLLTYRLPLELAQIDAGIAAHPDFRVALLIQRLKLTGHALETLARLSASGREDAPSAESLRTLVDEVAKSVKLMDESNLLHDLKGIRLRDEQRYLDIVGDCSHALRGLKIVFGEAPVYY